MNFNLVPLNLGVVSDGARGNHGYTVEVLHPSVGVLKDREGCWKDEEIGERERQIRN